MATPRAVMVRRATELDEVIGRHGTRGQAEFFLRTREQSIEPLVERHRALALARAEVLGALPADWRRAEVERSELARFGFEPDDIVLVVGQDGLVANVAKYLVAQPVIGIDPLPGTNPGVLVPHAAAATADLVRDVVGGRAAYLERTMVRAVADDGQELTALNEVYVGQEGHQSARYVLGWRGVQERQSSSGVIVGTGTGASGWCASIQRASAPGVVLPEPAQPRLAWFVREPWPSAVTGTDLAAGVLGDDQLLVKVESESLVTFGDGIEADRLVLGWGQRVLIGRSPRVLRTVV